MIEKKIHSQVVFKKAEDIVARTVAGEMLLVPIRGRLADMEKIFSLNPVAEYIWNSLDGKRHLEILCQAVVDEFEVTPDVAQKDVRDFIAELLDARLVEKVD